MSVEDCAQKYLTYNPERINVRAFYRWTERGQPTGTAIEDWLWATGIEGAEARRLFGECIDRQDIKGEEQ